MRVDDTLLKKLEKLSYIEIKEEKRAQTIEQLQEILSFVENLNDIDTQSEDTKFLMTKQATHLRADEPLSKTEIADDILEHAPRSEAHLFVVPKIIE